MEKMNRFKSTNLILVLVATSLLAPVAQAHAGGKNNNSMPKSETSTAMNNSNTNPTQSGTSVWISPVVSTNGGNQAGTVSIISVHPGAAIPIAFRVFENSTTEITSPSSVTLNQVTVSGCGVTNLPRAKNAGKSFSTLKYNKNGFKTVFKTSKASTGCFKFEVKKTGSNSVLLTSPTFNLNS